MIDKINAYFSHVKPIEQIKQQGPAEKTKESAAGQANFSDMFSQAIREVDDLQKSADEQIQGLVLEKDGVTTHGAMLALEKADVAFQLMNNIRQKIVRAYEDVIRTGV